MNPCNPSVTGGHCLVQMLQVRSFLFNESKKYIQSTKQPEVIFRSNARVQVRYTAREQPAA